MSVIFKCSKIDKLVDSEYCKDCFEKSSEYQTRAACRKDNTEKVFEPAIVESA